MVFQCGNGCMYYLLVVTTFQTSLVVQNYHHGHFDIKQVCWCRKSPWSEFVCLSIVEQRGESETRGTGVTGKQASGKPVSSYLVKSCLVSCEIWNHAVAVELLS